ncbi:MAG: precorrin-2 C(20)-methyltransferase [Lachnospiraceae bacterium]|nr:precorrin-2 C(20)-methyltransferase [Lachnospiraceae bacterium]
MKGKLYGVGVGPGDPELLTLKALRLIKECPVIGIPGKDPKKSVALEIVRGAYPEIDNKELLMIATPMTKDMDVLNEGYRKAAELIEEVLDGGRDVAVLTLGDPTVYSTYIYMQRFVVEGGYEAEIVSGITSFCATAAKFCDSLGDREEMIHIIPASYQIEEALRLPGTKVLMKAGSKLGNVKATLKKTGQKAVMIEDCGMKTEKMYYSVDEMPEEGSYYSLTIVKD